MCYAHTQVMRLLKVQGSRTYQCLVLSTKIRYNNIAYRGFYLPPFFVLKRMYFNKKYKGERMKKKIQIYKYCAIHII